MRINNPALRAFSKMVGLGSDSYHMTVQGTIAKLALSLLMCVFTGSVSWWSVMHGYQALANLFMITGAISGIILAFVTLYRPHLATRTVPAYALCKGLLLGAFSAIAETIAPGTTLLAVALTAGTAAAFLLAYQFNVLRVTDNFRLMVISATGGVAITYLLAMILSLFGIRAPFIHDSNIYGIIFSLVIVAIASFNLVLDFDFIEQQADKELPKYMEWYGAFTVLLTLLWIYVEIVKLLLKLRRRR